MPSPTDLRCSDVSVALGEPLAGTAPTDEWWLFVEHPGSWGPKAPADLLPPMAGIRQQLIRGVGRTEVADGRRRAFLADLRRGTSVPLATAVMESLDPEAADWQPYDGPLWMVCTNGRRDQCCAELGRPVAATLAERWPGQVWETTHLGGHRFAPTLLALPSGYALGRVTPDRAVAACEEILAGRLPLDLVRGRVGQPPREQVAELFVRERDSLLGIDDPVDTTGVEVVEVAGAPRRTSCGDTVGKPVTTYVARS